MNYSRFFLRFTAVGLIHLVAVVGCSDDCSHSLGSTAQSPNGHWTAQVRSEVCGGRVLALGSTSTSVVLTRHQTHYLSLSTTVFSGVLPHEGDIITVRWASDYSLELTMPNQANIDELMASYEGIDISVQFVPPDPRERAKWVDFQRLQTEEMGDADAPPSTGARSIEH
jgi:hypothetical protein